MNNFGMHRFGLVGGGLGLVWLVLMVLFIIFWVWAIVDAARRSFKNDMEKPIWILVLVFGSWIGLIVYLLVIKYNNPNGIMKK